MQKPLECCQNTLSPTGRLCADCPHNPVKPVSDILDPKQVADRMKERGTFHKDEPWPGWNGGKKIIEKDPEPESNDEITEGYGHIPWSFKEMDMAAIEQRVLAHMMDDLLKVIANGFIVPKELLSGGSFHCGGIVSGRWYGGFPLAGESHSGMQIARRPRNCLPKKGTITMQIGGPNDGKVVRWYNGDGEAQYTDPPQDVGEWYDDQYRIACGIILPPEEHH